MAIYNDVTTLYNTVLKEIAYNEDQYKKYLDISAIHYKHSFSNVVLIYAQKPTATALATFYGWSKKIGRRINKGAKGVPLFGINNGTPIVRYYFDVADTNGNIETLPAPWKINSENENKIINYFSKNDSVPYDSFVDLIEKNIENEIKELLPKHFKNFTAQNDSLAYENFIDSFYNLAFNSVKYRVFKRCDLDVSNITFPDIEFYQDTKLSIFLGTSSSIISTKILKEIEKSINIINERNIKNDRELRNEISTNRRGSSNTTDGYESIRETDRQIWSNGKQISSRRISNQIRGTFNNRSIRRNTISNKQRSFGNFENNNRTAIEEEPTEKSKSIPENITAQKSNPTSSGRVNVIGSSLYSKVNDNEEKQLSLFSKGVVEELKSLAEEKEVIEPKEFTPIELNKLKFSALKHGTGNLYDKYYLHEKFKNLKDNNTDFLTEVYKNAQYPSFEFEFKDKTAQVTTDKDGFKILVPNKDEVFSPYSEAPKIIEENRLVFYYADTERETFRNLEVALLAAPLEIKEEIYTNFKKENKITSDVLKNILFNETWSVNCFGDTNIACENTVLFSMTQKKFNYNNGSIKTNSNWSHKFTYDEISNMLNSLVKDYNYLDYGKFDETEELNAILKHGGCCEGDRYRTYEFFSDKHSKAEKKSFLRKAFGESGAGGEVLSHKEYGNYDSASKGIKIRCDLYPDNNYTITWPNAVNAMDKLFDADEFFTKEQKAIFYSVNDLATFLFKEYSDDLPDFSEYGYTFENKDALCKFFTEKEINFPLTNGQDATVHFKSYTIDISLNDVKGRTEYSRLCELFKREAQSQIISKNILKDYDSYEKRIYKFFKDNYSEILNGTYTYMNFESSPFMPLTLETVPEGKTGIGVSISHYYIQNGNLMYDPEIVFAIDNEKEEAYPHSFKQDNLGVYQLVFDGKTDNKILGDEICEFFLDNWSENLNANSYILTKVITEEGERLDFSDENHEVDAETFMVLEKEKEVINQNGVPYIEDTLTIDSSNFYINDDFNLYGGAKTKFKQNIEAIKLLHNLQKENRNATHEEKSVLAKYTGWGGLSSAFDSENLSWQEEYNTLKEILSAEDYTAARESTLTSYYTDKPIIDYIYTALSKFDFKEGKLLEPALGVGNFFGRLPGTLKNCKLYGVELNSISGDIAKNLYPSSEITIDGFENVPYEDNYFDVVVGNVPFGNYKIFDNKYNKYNFLIHDYFFAKALDNIKPGGILAFVTSSGTLDKANPTVRKYLADRAELIGAVRLPNNAFKKIAGTEVTSDIIFLQKKQTPYIDTIEPSWINTGYTPDGFVINQYFIDNPQMLLGKIDYDTRFGKNERNNLCVAPDGFNLEESLNNTLNNLNAKINTFETPVEKEKSIQDTLPADPNIKNFTYCFIDDALYYRENSLMYLQDIKGKTFERIKGLHEIRNIVRDIIDIQTVGCTQEELKQKQNDLNVTYDNFVEKYGYITDSPNKRAFLEDNDYPLLSSLEYMDEKENIIKADIFTKQTINPHIEITNVDTPSEALMVSLNIKGQVDIPYMCNLCDNSPEEMIESLKGQIYINPKSYNANTLYDSLEPADEYLSGNVREKLVIAKTHATENPDLFKQNVEALEKVQPEDIEAADIRVKLGVNWIDIEDYEEFIYETCGTPLYLQRIAGKNCITVNYNKYDSSWSISNKSSHASSITVTETYGTSRMTAYQIIEASLNQKQAIVKDRIDLDGGKYKYVTNAKETELAKEKQTLLQEKFREWVFDDLERRNKYVKQYNEKFNSIRLRNFDGSFQTFPNMNPEIKLRNHQLSAIARAKFNGNTLLAHAVGAGKTFEMDAIIMEKKRLGLIKKACMVVPNHLTEQAAAELLTLYPSANILLTTKKDFEKNKRQRFISRIATGEYDCVIMGSSQFEKIPMSKEYQEEILNNDLEELVYAIQNLDSDDRYSIKQLERIKKNIENKLETLMDDSKKDSLITFEQLGFDFIAVDEAHNYKNCSIFTKMNGIAGISNIGAKKSYDLLMKCKYINEKTNYKNIVFATGTPVANSMTELFTMKKYLRPDILEEQGLYYFDNWAALYGEVVSSLELAPAGNGFRVRQRFAKFVNLPELLVTFKQFADVQTADMLNLPIPELKNDKPITVTAEPDETQKSYIKFLADRMEVIHSGGVDPRDDNALKVTHEARLLGTDARLILPDAENNPGSKVNLCINNIYDIYKDNATTKSSQIVFCDVGTPKVNSSSFILYDYIKEELINRGIPEDEIAFAHDAKNEKQRAVQFSNIRNGNIRVIIASTAKMGTGANIQKNLVALHHLDIPWRPADIEQRNGRILRQGNDNKEVAIYQYVTKGTFDAYMWSTLENKQKFISQIMNSKAVARTCEDVDESVLNYAEVKAIATGDPRIKEKMELDMDINRLQTLKASFTNSKHRLQDNIEIYMPKKILNTEQKIELLKIDIEQYKKFANSDFNITLNNINFTEREPAGEYLFTFKKEALKRREPVEIGEYKGYKLYLSYYGYDKFEIIVKGAGSYKFELSDNHLGSIIKIDNSLKALESKLDTMGLSLEETKKDLENAKQEYTKPFVHEEELTNKIKRQIELNSELNLDKVDDVIADETLEESVESIEHIDTSIDLSEKVEILEPKQTATTRRR